MIVGKDTAVPCPCEREADPIRPHPNFSSTQKFK